MSYLIAAYMALSTLSIQEYKVPVGCYLKVNATAEGTSRNDDRREGTDEE